MRSSSVSFVSFAVLAALLPGCGSGQASPGTSSSGAQSDAGASSATGFDPPPPPEGYQRFAAATVPNVAPGDDVTYCQYVMAPLDHDVDVLSVRGFQSKLGHHAAAFVYTPQAGEEPGASFPCMGTEFTGGGPDGGIGATLTMGSFLGAVGGAGTTAAAAALPDGVGVRLKKGSGVMLNVHYLNSSTETLDGNAVVDVKFADPDPSRKLAAMFVNLKTGFTLPAGSQSTSSIDCVAQSDVELIMMTNHMHEFGTSASTEVQRAGGGASEMLHEDPKWTFDLQFNADYSRWPLDAPFLLHAGDTIRTTCNWSNTTSAALEFPREMCVGVGFALATGDHPSAPLCADGTWVPGP